MLQDKIDKHLMDKNKKNTKRGISPSSLGSCPRKLYCMHKDCECLEWTAQQLRVFEAGNLIETFAKDTLGDSVIEYQKKVTYREMTGTLDMIVKTPAGKNRLIDIKSCNSMKFKYLDKEGIDDHYAYQIVFYWLALEAEKYPDLDNVATVYYIEKDCLLTKEITIKPDQFRDQINKRLDAVKRMIETDQQPAEKKEIDWECFSVSKRYKTVKIWCNYIEHCPVVLSEYYKAIAEMQKVKDTVQPDSRLSKTVKDLEPELMSVKDEFIN